MLGDADLDGQITIVDVTFIQRHSIKAISLSEDALACSDVDGNGKVDIVDATFVQRYTVNVPTPYKIGEWFGGSDEPTTAPTTAPTSAPVTTQPVTDAPTTAPTSPTELVKLPNKFVAIVYCEAAGTDDASRNSEHAFDEYGRLTYNFQGASYVFVRNYDTGIQYCTDGWSNFEHPVTLVNEANLTQVFDKMYIPEGEHTLVLQPGEGDTYVLDYDTGATPVVNPTSVAPTTSPIDPTTSSEISFLLTDNFGWGSAYVYAWDANGNALNGEWPGASQAETITNGYGETQFRCYVPAGAVGVILNNGNGAQTEDITDFGTYEGYWMDGTKNNLGHYKVTGWNS
jgi:hypothetical protein